MHLMRFFTAVAEENVKTFLPLVRFARVATMQTLDENFILTKMCYSSVQKFAITYKEIHVKYVIIKWVSPGFITYSFDNENI